MPLQQDEEQTQEQVDEEKQVQYIAIEEEALPLVPKRLRVEAQVPNTKRRKSKKKTTSIPHVLEIILVKANVEDEEDEKMDYVPLG